MPADTTQDSNRLKSFLLIGCCSMILAIVIAVFFILIYPCLLDQIRVVVAPLFALGISLIVVRLRGNIKLKSKTEVTKLKTKIDVDASGEIALFLVILLLSGWLIFNVCGNIDSCKENLDITILLRDGKDKIPAEIEGHLQLLLDYGGQKGSIESNADVEFRNIPASYSGKKIAVELDAKYWEFGNGKDIDTMSLTSEKNYRLIVKRNGSLSKIFGTVSDTKGAPLQGVIISVDSKKDSSDLNGFFELHLEDQFQKKEQTLQAFKVGYKIFRKQVYPEFHESIPILLEKK